MNRLVWKSETRRDSRKLTHKKIRNHPTRRTRDHGGAHSHRLRGAPPDVELPFEPPEEWHEPTGAGGYRIIVRDPGPGYRHILTPAEIRERLSQLPPSFLRELEVVQFARMTRKKQSFPCYGMQWGSTIYLYPIETNLTEYYGAPPTPAQRIEAQMYGGRWLHEAPDTWKLCWTEQSLKNFYLHNILIHEIGHLIDNRNTRHVDRERYAEWFAVEYGYRPIRMRLSAQKRRNRRRHA